MNKLNLVIRFDDICPTMNHGIWGKVEGICKKYRILPIIAVIPDNYDPKFSHKCDPLFWNHIKTLQLEGWSVGLHGLHHTFISNNSGFLRITDLSEFVPRTLDEQKNLIENGIKIFKENYILVDMFIAPFHSFDNNTIKALKSNGIYKISDGFYSRPIVINNMKYIPSQLWEKSKIPSKGFYTVCCHTENWDTNDLSYFEAFVEKYKDNIISASEIQEFIPAKINDKLLNLKKVYLNLIKRKMGMVLKKF